MTRPTWDELRAKMPVKGKRGLYAGPPGSGPPGRQCRHCAFMLYNDPQGRARYPKCGKVKYTSGDATTIHTTTPACLHFEPYVDHDD